MKCAEIAFICGRWFCLDLHYFDCKVSNYIATVGGERTINASWQTVFILFFVCVCKPMLDI